MLMIYEICQNSSARTSSLIDYGFTVHYYYYVVIIEWTDTG